MQHPFNSDSDSDSDTAFAPTARLTDAAPTMVELEQQRHRGVRVQPVRRFRFHCNLWA